MPLSSRVSLPLLVTVGAWGFNFTALKVLYHEVPPPAVGLVRFVLMWIILALYAKSQGESLKYPAGKAFQLLSIGFLSMGVYMILFLEGLARTGAAEGAIILASAPVFTALFAVFFKQEVFQPKLLVGCFFAILGVGCVVSAVGVGQTNVSSQEHWTGVGLVFASAVVWALQAVHSRPLLQDMSSLRLLTISMPGALVILVPYGLLDSIKVPWTELSMQAYATFAHVTLLAGVAGFLGFYLGVRAIGPSRALLYQYFVPPLAVAFEALILKQLPTIAQFVGMVLIVGGVTFASGKKVVSEPSLET